MLKFLKPPNSAFKGRNSEGIKYQTRLCIGVSHLLERKFKNSLQDH